MAFEAAVAARVARRPVSQIVGERPFFGRSFKVTQRTLDPRPETELLVQSALERPFVQMLDLGTGTQVHLPSCLAGTPIATGVGTDLSPAVLAVAAESRRAAGAGAASSLSPVGLVSRTCRARFDLIVSNPPYIAVDEMAGLAPEVRDGSRICRLPGWRWAWRSRHCSGSGCAADGGWSDRAADRAHAGAGGLSAFGGAGVRGAAGAEGSGRARPCGSGYWSRRCGRLRCKLRREPAALSRQTGIGDMIRDFVRNFGKIAVGAKDLL